MENFINLYSWYNYRPASPLLPRVIYNYFKILLTIFAEQFLLLLQFILFHTEKFSFSYVEIYLLSFIQFFAQSSPFGYDLVYIIAHPFEMVFVLMQSNHFFLDKSLALFCESSVGMVLLAHGAGDHWSDALVCAYLLRILVLIIVESISILPVVHML